MQEYPHRYLASAAAQAEGEIRVSSPGLEDIPSMPPPEFDGPGGYWSPEAMLVASIADCFILTFRAVARGARFDWNSLSCEVEGVLDRVDRVTRFTDFHVRVTLHVPEGADEHKAERLAEMSDHVCLVTNSLNGERHLSVRVVADDR
jgi:organic hydroperoxide reductase OsmC/OhrA